MRRTTSLTAAPLLGLALLAPSTAATAAGETCRGETATIVGTGPAVTGTEGRDVIVSGKSTDISTLGGDDLVCLAPDRPNANLISVDAGAGNDVVDTTASPTGYYNNVALGTGADTFAGGRSADSVITGAGAAEGIDADRDDVRTGDGSDSVTTGAEGQPNRDVIDTGEGNDWVTLVTWRTAPDGLVTGGLGPDTLVTTSRPVEAEMSADMTTGTLSGISAQPGIQDVSAHFSSFEALDLQVEDEVVTYRGTPGNDHVEVHPQQGAIKLDIATAAGQDQIVVEPAAIAAGSRIDGGDGRNGLIAANETGSMTLDLEQGVMVIDGQSSTVAGLQDALLMAPEVTMVGNDRGNNLSFAGCVGNLRGHAGRDRLRNVYDGYFEFYIFDCQARTEMLGGPAADHLRGGQGADRLLGGSGTDEIEGRGGSDRIHGNAAADTLIGGRGFDRVDGSKGRDRCVAEREQRCER